MSLLFLDTILFCVFWVIGFVFWWPGMLANAPWGPHALYMLLFALLGLAVFGFRL